MNLEGCRFALLLFGTYNKVKLYKLHEKIITIETKDLQNFVFDIEVVFIVRPL